VTGVPLARRATQRSRNATAARFELNGFVGDAGQTQRHSLRLLTISSARH
jgi:hypothetical protein